MQKHTYSDRFLVVSEMLGTCVYHLERHPRDLLRVIRALFVQPTRHAVRVTNRLYLELEMKITND